MEVALKERESSVENYDYVGLIWLLCCETWEFVVKWSQPY